MLWIKCGIHRCEADWRRVDEGKVNRAKIGKQVNLERGVDQPMPVPRKLMHENETACIGLQPYNT